MAILNKRRSTSQLPQLQQRSIYEPFVNLEAGERGREILRPSGVRDRGNLSIGRPVTSIVQGDGVPSLGGAGRQPSLGGVTSRPATSKTSSTLAPRTSLTSTGTGGSKPAATKPAATTAKPSITSKTTAAKPAISGKPTTPASKTQVTPTAKPVVKKSTGTTSKLGTALTGAALGATTKAVIDKITGTKTPAVKPPVSPVVKPPGTPKPPIVKPPGTPKPPITSVVNKPNIGTPPFVPPKTTVKPPIMGGGTGVKPGGGAPTLKPPAGGGKPPVVPKGSTAGATGALTEDQIQAELDRVRTEGEGNVVPEGAITNEDGSYSVTEDGMVTTYDKDGNIVGMEAVTDGSFGEDAGVAGDGSDTTSGLTRSLTGGTGDTTTVNADTSGMTDLGEGYFEDASGNIYGADGNLMYTVGEDGEYIDAGVIGEDTSVIGDETEDVTTYTDPDTGETWNMGEDGEWTQEGYDSSAEEEVTSWTDPDTGFTWNMGDDGTWSQEGFDETGFDETGYEDTGFDDTLGYDDTGFDDTEYSFDEYEGDFKRGGLAAALMKRGGKARRFDDGGYTGLGYGEDEGYSDTTEEVQPFQNVDYNYGEFDEPTMTGDNSLYSQSGPLQNTYLRSALAADDDEGIEYPISPSPFSMPEGWPAGFTDNGDGTATYVDDDGSTVTIDADNNIVYVTDTEGNAFDQTGAVQTPSTGITSTGGTGGQRYRTEPTEQPADRTPDNSGILNTIKDSLGTYAGSAAAGALLASLLESADNEGGGGSESGIDMSQVGVLNPRTTDFGIGPARYVGYDEYGAQDEMPEMYGNELYKNLNAPGFNPVNEGDYADPEEVQYGDEGEMAEASEEAPQMADGGAAYQTHYTFGKSVDPLVNLGLKAGQPMKSGGLSHGGLPAFSNVPITQGRLNFKKGAPVHGPGDGQSDDIPAMLADGEYVIDAETVAQIGNGSTKAGAHALDKFRENIRAHKRSAPINKIPPKTKALTSYLRGAK